jgi:SPP1 family predicted phage head-tail adaptor
MKAGALRHLITLLSPPDPVATVDTYGDVVENYTTVAQVWGAIEPLTVREIWLAQQARADVTHKITLRWRGDVSAKWRVSWNDGNRNRVFELGPALSTQERHLDLIFTAIEKVP